jgi:hypothetical protein
MNPASNTSGGLLNALREASAIHGTLAVHVVGQRSGTVYLKDGRITALETSEMVDIRKSVTRSAPASTGPGDLIDAAYGLFDQPDRAATKLRLVPGVEPAADSGSAIGVDALIEAVSERVARCAGLGVDPDLPVELRPTGGAGVVLDDETWSVIAGIDGRLTPRDLAWSQGAELYTTLIQVGRLISAGLVRSRAERPAPWVAPPRRPVEEPAGPSAAPASVELRLETTAEVIAAATDVATAPIPIAPAGTAVHPRAAGDDPDLIQRLIDGLREMG